MSSSSCRGTLFLEDSEILDHQAHAGAQYVLRLRAPECARRARPGSFVHLRCDPGRPLRRPLSILRAQPEQGWIEILYKAVGAGTRALARQQVGTHLSLIGPIGHPFRPDPRYPRPLLIGGGVGMPPLFFLADTLRHQPLFRPLGLFGSEVPFPFSPRPSQFLIPGLPPEVIAAAPLLDDWGIPSRLASRQGYPGCFLGDVPDLARAWLASLDPQVQAEVALFACGPQPMLAAVAALAKDFGRPCQVSLEEFMACGIGGCAGCAVPVRTPEGPAMQRVCVEGPVFDAGQIF